MMKIIQPGLRLLLKKYHFFLNNSIVHFSTQNEVKSGEIEDLNPYVSDM